MNRAIAVLSLTILGLYGLASLYQFLVERGIPSETHAALLAWGLGGACLTLILLFVNRLFTHRNQVEDAVRARTELLARNEQRMREDLADLRHAEESSRASARRAESLLRTAARLNQHIETRELLNTICEEATSVLDLPVAAIALFDEKKQHFRLAASKGLPDALIRQVPALPLKWFRQQTVAARYPFLVPDLQKVDQKPLARLFLSYDFRTIAFVELHYRQRLLGLLLVSTLGETRAVDGADLALLGGLADQAAQVIAHVRLFKTLRYLLRQTQRQSRQQQRIMDAVPEGLLMLNGTGQVLLTNPAGRRFLGQLAPGYGKSATLAALGGKPLDDLLEQASARWVELQTSTGEEESFIFELTARAIEDASCDARWIVVIRDVTMERQRREIAQSQDRLATVGQMAAGIAHDFNNIMAIITLYSQTLERNPDFAKRGEYLATISEQAQHASELIVQILDFSRRAVMERGRLDLLPFIKEIVKMLQRTLPESIAISLQAEPAEYLVEADPTRLRQALMNLALNARDAMPAGGELQISLSEVVLHRGERLPIPGMATGRYMCLSVADTGHGIPADALPHLFEPFFTTKETGKGTGMGLAQVYGIVKQHGGEIEVDSSPGKGARFTIFLPALLVNPSDEHSYHIPQTITGGDATVLLVEDHEPTREAIADTLELLGYNVLIATTGREALDVYEVNARDIDLVLSDVVMPEMGGVELYRNLMARDAELKMIVMTGYPLENEGRSLLEQGIVEWIRKPFSPDALGAKLANMLDT